MTSIAWRAIEVSSGENSIAWRAIDVASWENSIAWHAIDVASFAELDTPLVPAMRVDAFEQPYLCPLLRSMRASCGTDRLDELQRGR